MRLCAKTARWACAASMVVLLAGCNGAGSGGPPDNGGNGGGGGSGGGSGGDGGSGGGGGAGGGSGGSTLSIVRTNQPVFEGGGLHASETGGIIAFDFVDADEDITVGYWDIDSDTAFLNVRVTGFDNTAGVADAMKPLREDFRCLGRKLLLTDQKTIGLFDADDGQGQALALPDGPGAYRYLPNTGLAGDGGRYGAAILENTGDVDISKFDFHKLIAIDGDAESVIEFSHPSAESATSSFDFHHAAVAGSQVALLRDDLTDPFLGANTILVFDAAAPDTEPASHVMDFAVSESVLEFDGRFALMLNENEDRIVIFDTDQGTTQEVDPVFGGNIAQFGFDRMSKSINNGVIGYTTSEGDNFGFTIQAATGPATSATATRVGDDSATASSPPGYGNSVAVSASGRVFSAGERDISIQGGNLSEVTGGSASFITDGVGDAAADGFISASDIGAVGDLVFFKTGLDGNNNAANDTVLSYFMVP